MGFRFGWWRKGWGVTWGPKGGWRFYGMAGGRRKKNGCLIPFVILITSVIAGTVGVLLLAASLIYS